MKRLQGFVFLWLEKKMGNKQNNHLTLSLDGYGLELGYFS